MIRYDRLWATMEAQGMTQYRLIKHYNFQRYHRVHPGRESRPGGTFCPRSRFRGKGDILQIQKIRLPQRR